MAAKDEPHRILATWAGLETLIDWLVARHITQGSQTHLDLFMRYYAARADVSTKINVLGEIIKELGLSDDPQRGKFLGDLRAMWKTRDRVAHMTAIKLGDTRETVWFKMTRSGRPERIGLAELREEVDRVLDPLPQVREVISAVATAVGLPRTHSAQPGSDRDRDRGTMRASLLRYTSRLQTAGVRVMPPPAASMNAG